MPQARNQQEHALQLEEQVQRYDRIGFETDEAVGRRKRQTQENVRQREFGKRCDKRFASKKVLKPAERKECAEVLKEQYGMSIRQACSVVMISRSLFYYQEKKSSDDELILTVLNKFAELHPTYGFWKMYNIMRSKGAKWNHKKVYRVYTELKMNIRRKMKRRLPERVKQPLNVPEKPNQVWSLDFMTDTMHSGRKFRVLNIIDDFNREALTMISDVSITSARVVNELQMLCDEKGKPEQIRTDNGPEFISLALRDWCSKNNVEHVFIQPGKPTQNAFVERFNGSYRRDILNAFIFTNLAEVRFMTNEWMENYNTERPHDSLGNLSPKQFLLKHQPELKHNYELS